MGYVVLAVVAILVLGYLSTFVIERRRRRRLTTRAENGTLRPEELQASERDGLDNPIAAEGLLREGLRDHGAGGSGLS